MRRYTVTFAYGRWQGTSYDPIYGLNNHYYADSLEDLIRQISTNENVSLTFSMEGHKQ